MDQIIIGLPVLKDDQSVRAFGLRGAFVMLCEACCEFCNIEENERERQKAKRRLRRYNSEQKDTRLYREIQMRHGIWHPSIRIASIWNSEVREFESLGRVKRAGRSDMQRWMKKRTNRLIRHLPSDDILPKSNLYQKYFDYLWTWY